MIKRKLAACIALAAAVLSGPANADDTAELEKIRAEIQQMKQTYEARIQTLEAKLAEVQQQQTPQPEKEQSQAVTTDTGARSASSNAFNPGVALILQGAYTRRKDIPDRTITGFLQAEDPGNKRGFSADATELALSSNIDPYLRGFANIAMEDGEAEVEEAFFETLGLGHGITLKGGRFRSGIGYQNELHPHAWDFADNSLMYQTLFGEGLITDGVQAKWVAPTDLLVEFGAEVGRGAELNNYNGNGAGTTSLFGHVGGDIGVSHSWRAGLSWVNAKLDKREFEAQDISNADVAGDLSGRSRLWIADFIYKWAPNGNSYYTNFKLQGEYFHRNEHGRLGCDSDGPSLCSGGVLDGAYRSAQSGGYLQGVYQFRPEWRVGLRYDRLNRGSVDLNGNDISSNIASLADYDPRRYTAMLDFSPSEFSRFRLQVARDESMQDVTDNQLTLQYIMSLGTHGAHRF